MKRSLPASLLATAALLLILAAATACGTGDGKTGGTVDDSKALEGKTWRATAITGVDKVLEAKEFFATAKFSNGEITGSSTINRYGSTFITGLDNTIEISPSAGTLMAGPEDAMAQELAYIEAIQRAATYRVTADSLALLDEKGELLVEYTVLPDTPLVGTEWQATAYNNGKGGLESLAIDSTITITFNEDGTLSGNASVNQYSGEFTLSGDDGMTIGPNMVSTAMAGPDELMAQEDAYLAALHETATYEIDGDTLWLRDADGAALAQFTAG